jgi:glyoxylase-like metal-dependent hydrolase (beta-lactamase superfamily II)
VAAAKVNNDTKGPPPLIKTIITKAASITVNCYLVQVGAGFFLIDTGMALKRDSLVNELELAGCQPGNLKLIILTHGDLDHSGNGAFLRQHFGAKIAMHSGDLANVERGDMFANKKINPIAKGIVKILFSVTRLAAFTTFTPDIFLEDGQSLDEYGWQATVMHLPGHSKGSIGILTPEGDLFCGDLLENTRKPAVNSLGDDLDQLKTSAEKLNDFQIKTVYPGHGQAFLLSQLQK